MPNGMGCWKATRNSCIVAGMLADDRPPTTASPARHDYDGRRDPLRSPRPFRRAPRPPGHRRVGRADRRGAAARAAGAGRAQRGWLHQRRPRVRPREGHPRSRARDAAVGARRRLLEPGARGRHPGLRAGRCGRDARHPQRAARGRRRLAPAPAAPGLGRSPHRLRHRPARPSAGRLPEGAADPAIGPPRGAEPDGRAGRRSGLLRRRPDGQRTRPPAQRAHLAAAGRARAPAGLRVGGGGRRPARRRRGERPRRAGRRLPDRLGDADEHLRAQPRHAPGPGPRRGLLPAHDQPVPRGAGQAPRGDRTRTSPRPSGSPSRPPAGPCSSAG